MKVQDIMTSDVHCCGPDTNLAAAAKMMWDSDCGALPVLNVQGQVLSMITDRDICMATATKNRPASDIIVWETVSGKAHTCHLSDDVHTALDTMKREKVRRLPVVDEDGVPSVATKFALGRDVAKRVGMPLQRSVSSN